MPDYCNITTDLQQVFSRIEDYQAKEILTNWTLDIGTIYYKQGTGYVAKVWWNGVALEAATAYPPSDGEFSFVADDDTLYVNNYADPDDAEVLAGEDWDSFKTINRDKAQQMVDAYLNAKYATPLIPRSRKLHDSADYEYPIVRATALCTCFLIINRVNPNDPNADKLYKEFYNPNPDIGEPKGIINQLLDGDMVLQDQISSREIGNWNIYPNASNSVDNSPILIGKYTGSQYKVWRIQVDGAGAPSAGTFKVSYDGGNDWNLTEKDMVDTDNDKYRINIADGIYIYWPDVSYSVGDYWDVELFPQSDTASYAQITSFKAV